MSDLSNMLTLELIRQLPILSYATEKAVVAGGSIDSDYEHQLRTATGAVFEELSARILAAGLEPEQTRQAANAVEDLRQASARRARWDLAASCLIHIPHTCGPEGMFKRARQEQLDVIRASSREALAEMRARTTLTRLLP
jgi:hypothetical protein